MTFNFQSKALFSLFLCSLSIQIMNFNFSQNPFFSFFDNFKNSHISNSEKSIREIQEVAQDSKVWAVKENTGATRTRDGNDIYSDQSPEFMELLKSFRAILILLAIIFLILSYRIRKTLEIYKFYNTDKEGVLTFRDEKEFEKHKFNAKKGKFMLFLGLVILAFGLYLFF